MWMMCNDVGLEKKNRVSLSFVNVPMSFCCYKEKRKRNLAIGCCFGGSGNSSSGDDADLKKESEKTQNKVFVFGVFYVWHPQGQGGRKSWFLFGFHRSPHKERETPKTVYFCAFLFFLLSLSVGDPDS